ncbi:hypothetical protein ABZV77_07425 [Streptomyces sp. NPDC004732]|uniref:hypothetical protein n=1 Tax=Streptomyces sp. NPDC004732 TaxID=3154290 RepID=UPI0033A31747
MKSAVSRVVAVVSVVVALGASAGCGGSGSDGGDGDARKSAKPGASAGPSKLEKAALTAADVKGYKVEEPDESEAGAGSGKPSRAECGPLAAMLGGGGSGTGDVAPDKAKSHVGRLLTAADGKDSTTTDVGLSSYAGTDAKQAMADLRAALRSKKCAAFRAGEQRYLGARSLAAPDKGDEAVSYKIAHRRGEYVTRESVTVVRSGSTLAVFGASNMYDPEGVQRDKDAEKDGMGGSGTPTADQDPKVDPKIVDAQLDKV